MKKQLLAVSMMTLFLSATAPFTSMSVFVYAANQPQTAPEPMKTLAQLDKKVVEDAKQAMQKLAGNVTIELNEITGMNPDCWVISAKDNRGEVLVTKNEGKVVSARVIFKFSEVDADLQNTVMSTLKGMDGKQSFTIDQVDRINWEKENIWQFWGKDAVVIIDAATGKVNSASLDYHTNQIDPKAVDTAQKALQSLSNGKASELLPEVTLVKDSQRHLDLVWSFMDRERTYGIMIGAKTGKVLSATAYNEFSNDNYVSEEDLPQVFAKPFYTKEKAIAAANPVSKKILHIDLTGYNVSCTYNKYTFTKQGKPTVTASINKKGVFYDFIVTPESGMLN
ncbi:hypothetical protein ACI7RC_22930 [Brevibacillus sp. B_LB10_24]|uniref:hypothetical protein n=1 Tax=Brevibacillus sp. B_LB10_24 TaxID=3380645 RepID=UPI0038BC35D8